jgi:hypothetical protein
MPGIATDYDHTDPACLKDESLSLSQLWERLASPPTKRFFKGRLSPGSLSRDQIILRGAELVTRGGHPEEQVCLLRHSVRDIFDR